MLLTWTAMMQYCATDPEKVMYSLHLLDMVIDKCCVSSRRLLLVSIEPTERDLMSCYTTGKKMQVYSLSNPKCKDVWHLACIPARCHDGLYLPGMQAKIL